VLLSWSCLRVDIIVVVAYTLMSDKVLMPFLVLCKCGTLGMERTLAFDHVHKINVLFFFNVDFYFIEKFIPFLLLVFS